MSHALLLRRRFALFFAAAVAATPAQTHALRTAPDGPAGICAAAAQSRSGGAPARSVPTPAGAALAQACPSPRCETGLLPCAFQMRPNGCVSWRCCVRR